MAKSCMPKKQLVNFTSGDVMGMGCSVTALHVRQLEHLPRQALCDSLPVISKCLARATTRGFVSVGADVLARLSGITVCYVCLCACLCAACACPCPCGISLKCYICLYI